MLDGGSQWWQKVDEAPYAVYVEPPAKRRRSSGTADNNGFSDVEDENALPDVDEGDDETSYDAVAMEDDDQHEDDRPNSPEEDEAEWADAFASDDDDEEFSDSEEDAEQPASLTETKINGAHPTKKRRRDDESDRGSESDGSSNNSSQRSNASFRGRGSNLQRRKKRALERTSSLTNVTNARSNGISHADDAASEVDEMEAAMREALGEALDGEGDD